MVAPMPEEPGTTIATRDPMPGSRSSRNERGICQTLIRSGSANDNMLGLALS
jgi:hypothetical protein